MSRLPHFSLSIAIALALALGVLPTGQAQESKPAAQEAPSVEAKKPAAKKPAVAKDRKSRRQQDARHCLQEPSNAAVIKCAEAYL